MDKEMKKGMHFYQKINLKLSTFYLIVLFHIIITLYLTFFEEPLPVIIFLLAILASIIAVRQYLKNRAIVNRHNLIFVYAIILFMMTVIGLLYSIKNVKWEGFGLISKVYNSIDDSVPVYVHKIQPLEENEYPQFPNLPKTNRFPNIPDKVPFYVTDEGFLWVNKQGTYKFQVDLVQNPRLFIDGNLIPDKQASHLNKGLHKIKIDYWKNNRSTNFVPKWYRVEPDSEISGEEERAEFRNIPVTHLFPSAEAFDNKKWLTVKYYTPYVLLVLWLPAIVYIFVTLIKNSSFRKKYLRYCILTVIMICGIWLRWFLLNTSLQFPDADEATIGIMSLKILRGESFLMYYGTPYIGSFDSLVSSLCFSVLGVNNLALKLSPFIVSLIVVYLTYLLGSEIYNLQVGLLASLFVSIGTPFMIDWSLRLTGGHVPILMFGNILFFLTYRIVFKKQESLNLYKIMGFISGFSLWIHTTSILYIITILIFLLLNDKKFFFKKTFVLFALYFTIGTLPLIIWNWQTGFETINFFVGSGLPFMHNILRSPFNINNMLESISAVIGLSPSLGIVEIDILKYTTIAIYSCVFLHLLITRDRGIYNMCKLSLKESDGTEMFIVLACLTTFLYLYSHFGYTADTARYFIPFFSILPIMLARFVIWVKDRKFTVSVLLTLFILYINLLGNFRLATANLTPLRKDLTHVVQFLEAKGIKYLRGSYWLVGRLVFESEENIIALAFKPITHLPYEDIFKRQEPNDIAYITTAENKVNVDFIEKYTEKYTLISIGDFNIYFDPSSGK